MKIISIGLLVVASLNVFGQYEAEKFDAALLQAKYGAMLVFNGQKNSFTLKFISKSVVPTEHANFLTVDNILMQASLTPFQQKFTFANLEEKVQKNLLNGWKDYEKEWVEEQLKIKVKETVEFIKIEGKQFLHWTYDMPKSEKAGAVEKQVYLVAICFDQLLILNGALEKGKSESALKEKLKSVASTLKLHPGQVQDIEKLYAELMK
jgi:hypothetical protein